MISKAMSRLLIGDCRESMRAMIAEGVKVQMCVTSPPYWGLRSYLPDGVKLRNGLSETDRAFVQSELCRLSINPIIDGV